jgi:hypothetical protein
MVETIDAGASDCEADATLRRASRAATVLLALVTLGDFLIFGHAPGLNLFAYAVAIAMGLLVLFIGLLPARPTAIALSLALVASAPLLETPSLLGILLAALGLAMLALVLAGLAPSRVLSWPKAMQDFIIIAPLRLVVDWAEILSLAAQRRLGRGMGRALVVWIVPLVCAMVFLLLFSAANPLIEQVLQHLDPVSALWSFDPARLVFWFVLAFLLWPLLVPRLARWRGVQRAEVYGPERENLLFGEAAIFRALIVFNVLFAVQTGLDLTYLWGGVALPDGMSHATYAHRGAYPLIATALLAAAFVLAAMRRNGPGESNPLIRRLVYAWIAQNIFLCTSSILRLDLYIETYSLTELRLAAGIWMGLVALGLGLILLRIWLRQSNQWLVATNLLAFVATLYGCALTDFSAVIARFNVDHSYELTGRGTALDLYYFSRLGPDVIPALDSFVARLPPRSARAQDAQGLRDILTAQFVQRDTDWRSWSLRDWRLEQYLAGQQALATGPHTDK